MVAAVLVSGPTLHTLLQLVDQTDGAAGEGLEAHGDDGELNLAHGKLVGHLLNITSVSNNSVITHRFKVFLFHQGTVFVFFL